MRSLTFLASLFFIAPLLGGSSRPAGVAVGPDGHGGYVVSTLQTVHPAGRVITFGGRPVDLALDSAHNRLFVKNEKSLVVINVQSNRIEQDLPYPAGAGASMHGIVASAAGDRIWVTTAGSTLLEAEVGKSGAANWTRQIKLPGKNIAGNADGCGIAQYAGHLAVCLSMANSVALVNLTDGKVETTIPVGIAPYDVVASADRNGRRLFVSNWGGRQPEPGNNTATSAGTPTRIDARGIANDGSVSVIDLDARNEVTDIPTGLHPAGMALNSDGRTLYVANANSDTVSAIDTATNRVSETIPVNQSEGTPFGSAPNALAVDASGHTLYVANGGNNCVAELVLGVRRSALGSSGGSRVVGLIPTGWYPGAVLCANNHLYVASVKGLGSRKLAGDGSKWKVNQALGCVNIVPIPNAPMLRRYTESVLANSHLQSPELAEPLRPDSDGIIRGVPLPPRPGEPSVFKHIIYILKENRSYDQIFGDINSGNGDSKLLMYGKDVTPNHHALADQFVLLDNYYCNGTLSADGHSWATEGNCTDHLEKSFGGFVRSYTFGDDPLTYSSSGFLWDKVLAAGLSFRNYGEMDYAEPDPKDAGFKEIYADYISGAGRIKFTHSIGIANLRRYTVTEYPGWNLKIPDQVRASIFLKDLHRTGREDDLASLTIIYLPCDHTSGTSPGAPTPRAQVADNDLALGRIVEGITNSRWWPNTCIFVNEDDPQDGYDHVDGHRSLCLVISPYTRRHVTVHSAYNQTSALHTMERILGLPPMNQFDAASPTMDACFTNRADLTRYTCLPNRIPLDEMNPPAAKLTGLSRTYARKSAAMDWSKPDAVDDEALNRILWFAAKH